MQTRLRGGHDRPTKGRDRLEHAEADTPGDFERSLLQMRATTLLRIDDALARLDAGVYGTCAQCDSPISERRLRALPFAVRCQGCEERLEALERQKQHSGTRRSQLALFVDGFGS